MLLSAISWTNIKPKTASLIDRKQRYITLQKMPTNIKQETQIQSTRPDVTKEEVYIKQEPIYIYEDDNDVFQRMIKKAFGEEKSRKFQIFVDASQKTEKLIILKTEEIEKLEKKIKIFNQSVDSLSTWNWKIKLGRMSLQKINLEYEQDKIRDKIYEMLYQIGTEPEAEMKKSKPKKAAKERKSARKRKAAEIQEEQSYEKICLMPKRRRKTVNIKSAS